MITPTLTVSFKALKEQFYRSGVGWGGGYWDGCLCNDVLLATGVNRMLLTTQTGSYTSV